ncbi:membrane protein [Chryseobacterium angstadtii]|uniref:Membrane protein n=1 Tax=Chryseobacterium angstadtii TaxID=558151 RepID=A0A0J7IG78_9FLAO|nr:membrane protein [Chryseobacterium angstadtii]
MYTFDYKIRPVNPILDVVVRSLCVYLFMVIAIRLFGKNQLSQLNAGDVVLLLLISNAVQNAMVGQDTSLQGGLIAALVLFAANFVLKRLMFSNRKFETFMEEDPVILIRDGVIDQPALNRVKITRDELEEAIREHGVEKINDVKLSILEVDGNISVVSQDETQKQTHYSRIKRKNKRKYH